MNTTKSIRCTIGRHHWQPTRVAGMHERVCADCGSHRFDASIHEDHQAGGGAISPAGPDPAHFLAGGGFTGGFGGGGFDGGGFGGGFA
jgi:hypothetical protein